VRFRAASIAMMQDEVVVKKKWLNDQQFLDLLGATNLIPGPNSTEMAIHIGRKSRLERTCSCRALLIVPAVH
jgi:chromate transporter